MGQRGQNPHTLSSLLQHGQTLLFPLQNGLLNRLSLHTSQSGRLGQTLSISTPRRWNPAFGYQYPRFKDNLTDSWESVASDRPSWYRHIIQGVYAAEKRRSLQAEQKRAAINARTTNANSTAPIHFCPTCGRGFLARIGLISHLWTCCTISTAN